MATRIEDVKHCLKVMTEQEVCEECNLYGTTGTDHCEHDCMMGALDIIEKYEKMQTDFYIAYRKIYDHHFEILHEEDSESTRAKLSLSNWVLDLLTGVDDGNRN